MKRSPLARGRVFDDEAFAQRYAERHRKMVERSGREYARAILAGAICGLNPKRLIGGLVPVHPGCTRDSWTR